MSNITFPQPNSLNELDSFIKSTEFDNKLEAIFNIPNEEEESKAAVLESLKDWERDQKQKFHPENSQEELKQLKAQVIQSMSEENSTEEQKEKHRNLLVQLSKVRAKLDSAFVEYEKVINLMQRKTSVVLNVGKGRSNRAKRAGLLSAHAGKSKIAGAQTDKHGNAQGTEYDLGVDGAFEGMKIVVIQLYSFESSYTKKAFAKKGFECIWKTSVPTAKELTELLLNDDTVCQLWIIDGNARMFSSEILEIIKEFHKKGKSLYIWGDNDPYIHNANQVLVNLFGEEMKMFGNVPGGKVVHLCEKVVDSTKESLFSSTANQNRGFVEHLITTGLEHLFEGITVASFNEKNIKQFDFSPLMWGSDANLITIYRPADESGGAVMCDGAFTRLYCNVDDAGTIRYIINCACWLAVESFGTESVFSLPTTEEIEAMESTQIKLNPTNAFQGKCSILWEKVPIVYLSIMKLADPEQNTTDFVLNDPLGFGDNNYEIIGRNLYGELTGKAALDTGVDPYLRVNVVGLLPVVSLKDFNNMQIFCDELCRVFMGYKKLYSQAQLLFIGVLDSILDPCRINNYENEIQNAIRFLFNECLHSFKSTPDFTDVGEKVSVLDAMKYYFTASTDLVQINKSISTVCLIARTLFDEKLVEIEKLKIIVSRSYYKFVISNCLNFVKNQKEKNGNLLLQKEFYSSAYDCWNLIPCTNSGHIITELPSFISDFYKNPLKRFEDATNTKVENYTNITYIFYLLQQLDLRSFKIEPLITKLLHFPEFSQIWNGNDLDSVLVVNKLNQLFSPFKSKDEVHSQCPIIPFVTTYGATIFSCSDCGTSFGDPAHEPSEVYAETVKRNRNQHFVDFYFADGNGYPTSQSWIYSLHRSIQIVMIQKYPGVLEFQPSMIDDIADRIRNLKGNIFGKEKQTNVRAVLESYLECRRSGQSDPPSHIHFYEKYCKERELVLSKNSS